MFTKGKFVEWTSKDEDGSFTHQGKVIDYSAVHAIIEITPNGSTIKVPHDDGTLREIPEPKEWKIALPKKEEVNTTSVAKPTIKRERSSTGESKADKALDIYKSMMNGTEHPKRGDVIKAFMEQLNMTQAGASTYQYNCKQKV